jgi:hypothetical protein
MRIPALNFLFLFVSRQKEKNIEINKNSPFKGFESKRRNEVSVKRICFFFASR